MRLTDRAPAPPATAEAQAALVRRPVHRIAGGTEPDYLALIRLDPWQAVGLAQRLRVRGLAVTEWTFSPVSVGRLAMTLHGLFNFIATNRPARYAPSIYRTTAETSKATLFLLQRNLENVTNGRHNSLLPAGEFNISAESLRTDLDVWPAIWWPAPSSGQATSLQILHPPGDDDQPDHPRKA